MMKKSVAFMATLMLASCGVGTLAAVTTPANTQVAFAKKAKKTKKAKKFKAKKLKSFPKAYRGTWYRYLGNENYTQLKITSKSLQNSTTGSYVFPARKQALKTELKHGYQWVNTRDADNPAGTSLHLRTTKVKVGKKTYKALIEVRGTAYSMPVTFYNKQFKNAQ